MCILVLVACLASVQAEAFWWDKVKAPKLNTKQFNKEAGGEKYVFVEFFTKACVYCEQFYPSFNKVYEDFTGSKALRNDITIIKIDGEETPDIPKRYGINSYPAFILLYPNDYIFPQKYLYERNYKVMRDYLMVLPKAGDPAKVNELNLKLEETEKNLKTVGQTYVRLIGRKKILSNKLSS